MKRLFILIVVAVCMMFTTSNINAKTYTYDTFQNLNVHNAMIVGDYVFNLDEGFSPSLQDIMIATRTIPMEKEVYLYYVINYKGAFLQLNMYTEETSTETADFKVFTAKYLYSGSIRTATEEDFKEI